MTADQIQAWAQEAGAYDSVISNYGGQFMLLHHTKLAHFARLVSAAAFEEAAKVCEQTSVLHKRMHPWTAITTQHILVVAIRALAAAEKEPR